jgi:surfactin synthase thioesterase subunit
MALRLVCLPYAGAGMAPFAGLRRAAAGIFEVSIVVMPGREALIGQPLLTTWDAVRQYLAREVLPAVGGDCVVYGHSVGALVGFELCRLAEQAGRPVRAFCAAAARGPESRGSGPAGPGTRRQRPVAGPGELTGDPDMAGLPPELRAVVMPRLRADYLLAATYAAPRSARLDSPLLALYGNGDAEVTVSHAKSWAGRTRGPFRIGEIDGGHLFVRDNPAAVVPRLHEFVMGRAA